jgi:hypothetical protein
MDGFWKYFFLGTVFWVVVDFSTAFNPDVNGWMAHMPFIWLFYLGSPLLFAYLIYRKNWNDRMLFLPLMVVLFVVEILFSFNALLFTFPVMLIMIPVAVSIYSFITYVPRWIIDHELKKHKAITAFLFVVWAMIAVLSFITRVKG